MRILGSIAALALAASTQASAQETQAELIADPDATAQGRCCVNHPKNRE